MFTDRLKLSVALTIGSDAFAVVGGAVTSLALEMTSYGFDASLSFVVSSEQDPDAIFPRFSTRDLIAVSATFERTLEDGSSDEDAAPFTVVGYVTEKSVSEIVAENLQSAPVIERIYFMRFHDVARVFWGEHYPVELHAGFAMSALLELHKATGMTLSYDWLKLLDTQDVLCLGLEVDRGVSFYDFVAWYADRFHGVIENDASSGTYRIGGSKSVPQTNVELDYDDVVDVRIDVAEPPRHVTNVLNPAADAATRTAPVINTESVLGVRRDVLHRTQLPAEFDLRVALETERIRASEHGITITFKRFPEEMLTPNGGLVFEDRFSAALYPKASKYRVIGLHLKGTAKRAVADMDVDDPSGSFDLELQVSAELQANRTPHLPAFRKPIWPVVVEGTVLSASGGDADRTWYASSNEQTSIYQYNVQVPLWNETIVVPFSPKHMTGHFFFPAFKTQRVLLGIGFDGAEILGFLDWAANAKLSVDTQGNAIALGYQATNGSLIRHQYEDGQPALHIQRTLAGDQETIDVTEGVIRIQVKEDPTVPPFVPTFDVTPQVETAKAQVASTVTGSVTDVTSSFETSIGGVESSLDDATGEVATAVTAASATIAAKADAVEAQLQLLGATAAGAITTIASKVTDAKAALQAALSS